MNLPATPERFRIRRARPEDRDAAYALCIQTGDSGAVGSHLYREDPEALPNLYVGAYLQFEPEFSFVLEDDRGVCGYALAALDSARFEQRFLREWLPPLQARFPEPAGDPATWTPVQQLYREYHHPQLFYHPAFQTYPSHAHIDLLARAQGQGQGKRMMRHQMATLAAHGSKAVHLGVALVNKRAEHFYRGLGFSDIAQQGDALFMGRSLP